MISKDQETIYSYLQGHYTKKLLIDFSAPCQTSMKWSDHANPSGAPTVKSMASHLPWVLLNTL